VSRIGLLVVDQIQIACKKREREMSSSSGYVAIPRYPVIFDGVNYPDFATFMHVYMRGLHLWSVLSGEVSCPPCPTAPLAPIPPTPTVLRDDATQADKDAFESADRSVVAAYDLQFQQYSSTLVPLRPIGWS
jgi:hypothetical protein